MKPPFLRRRRRRPQRGDLVEVRPPYPDGQPRLAICKDVKRRTVRVMTPGGRSFWVPARAVVVVETTA